MADYTWTGAGVDPTDIHAADNNDLAAVPGNGDTLTIPVGLVCYPADGTTIDFALIVAGEMSTGSSETSYTIESSGSIEVASGGTLNIVYAGTITNNNTLTVDSGGTFTLYASTYVGGISSSLNIYGTMSVSSASTVNADSVNIQTGGTLTLSADTTLVGGTFYNNSGTFTTSATTVTGDTPTCYNYPDGTFSQKAGSVPFVLIDYGGIFLDYTGTQTVATGSILAALYQVGLTPAKIASLSGSSDAFFDDMNSDAHNYLTSTTAYDAFLQLLGGVANGGVPLNVTPIIDAIGNNTPVTDGAGVLNCITNNILLQSGSYTDSGKSVGDLIDAAMEGQGTLQGVINAVEAAIVTVGTLPNPAPAGYGGSGGGGGGSDPWATALPGSYGAGTAGNIVGKSLRPVPSPVDESDIDARVAETRTQGPAHP